MGNLPPKAIFDKKSGRVGKKKRRFARNMERFAEKVGVLVKKEPLASTTSYSSTSLQCSTFGDGGLNYRVRNGIG